MDEFSYLLNCSEDDILNTWVSLGSITVNKKTKVYTRGSVVRIDASDGDGLSLSPLHNKIVYILEDYKVDNQTKGLVNWEELSIDDVNGIHAAVQGIQLPYFGILPAKWNGSFIPNDDFLPYSDNENPSSNAAIGGINISDVELETILTVIGFPFVVFDDIEYSKEQIIKYMVRPAMQRYFTFRPIIKEEPYGNIGANGQFCVEFPDGAYGCVPLICAGGAGASAGQGGSVFAMYGEQQMFGGGNGGVGSRYGRGLRYPGKRVPGYAGVGENDWRSAYVDNLMANQAYQNVFRREKYRKVKINGKYYATGFSTTGGLLNFKWLYQSTNWDDVEFTDLEPIARPMVRSEVLRNFHILRSLVKTDIAGQLDPAVFKELRTEIEESLKPIVNSIGITGTLAIGRGGGN